jgi:hypothetical protein
MNLPAGLTSFVLRRAAALQHQSPRLGWGLDYRADDGTARAGVAAPRGVDLISRAQIAAWAVDKQESERPAWLSAALIDPRPICRPK